MPLVGTWIEIGKMIRYMSDLMSCPSWARGLKYSLNLFHSGYSVVPLVGTWIEISIGKKKLVKHLVVPLVGTWIEIGSAVWISAAGGRAPYGHTD